ncbi:MAG: nitronate monooxygenase, partial [Candidatus Delongbacteria bacterium]|nr:nitronate monooxygenase [Candidatus Delongbacteria bacterium]
EKIDILFCGAGLPIDIPHEVGIKRLIESKVKTVPIVSSGLATKIILRKWDRNFGIIPDAFVVEGPLAGGHLGYKREDLELDKNILENIIPKVIAEIKPFEDKYNKEIPVIAGGGIYTGMDVYNILKNTGAKAVQMGTRFVGTKECDATDEFKNEYLKCKEDDIVIINSPVGLPGRAIRNEFLINVEHKKEKIRCPWICLKSCNIKTAHYCIGQALANAKKGNLEKGFAFCGANAYRIDKIVSVHELFEELEKEYSEAVESENI